MNKISKKIVALVTMAAFVLTLVPAAAFAAEDAAAAKSGVSLTSAQTDEVVVKTDVNAQIDLKDASGSPANSLATAVAKVWITKDGQIVDSTVAAASTGNLQATINNPSIYKVNAECADGNAFKVNFKEAGTYVIHAGAGDIETDGSFADNFTTYEKTATVKVYNAASANASKIEAVVNGAATDTVEVDDNQVFTINIDVNSKNDGDATVGALSDVRLWVVDESTQQLTDLAVMTKEDGTAITPGGQKGYALSNVTDNTKVKVKFGVPGTYTIYAGEGTDITVAQKNPLRGSVKVTVADTTAVDSMELTKVETKIDDQTSTIDLSKLDFDADTNTYTLNLAKDAATFNYDGIDTITLTGVAYEEDGTVAKNQTINFDTTKSTVVELKNTTDNTENDGKFSVAFTMSDKSNAVITMTDEASGLEYAVRVIAAETTAQNIDRTKTGGYVLAGNDSKYGEATYKDKTVKFTDAVQFAVTDEKGNAVTGVDLSDAKVDVRTVADGSTLKDNKDSLSLVWDEANGVYTLAYKGAEYATDLIPGKYEVRVALASGDNATVTFNVAKFGKVEDMVVDMEAANYFDGQQKPTDGVHAITDEVTLGQIVTVTAKYVDANGIKVPVDPATLQYGFDGKAVREGSITNNTFATAYDTPSNESLLGTAIHVKVFNQANKQLVEQDLTVVDSYNTYSLEFDPTTGPINEDNKVTVKVVDEDGNVAKLTNAAIVSAFVDSKSDENAKVSVEAANNGAVTNGKASLTLYSDRETTAEIAVVVKAGSAMYVGNLEYTFGTEDPLANRTVVMTIGSTEYVVNNKIVTGDAAPFVDSNWRTMVPLRALAESFDAEVNWDNDARTVTINYDANTQIVMTIGEETYTVNGEEMTMDTAPVIQGDRTYVPIRFAAQGMGFSVTPLYDSNGLTASVVFQK